MCVLSNSCCPVLVNFLVLVATCDKSSTCQSVVLPPLPLQLPSNSSRLRQQYLQDLQDQLDLQGLQDQQANVFNKLGAKARTFF